MTAIADLLDPTQARSLDFVVVKAATDPNPPRRPLALSDAIEIDPESEALILAPCVDCKDEVAIEPSKDVKPGTPRVPMCGDCHDVRVAEAKANGTLVRSVLAIVTHPVAPQKEAEVPNLDTMTDADLGAAARKSMKQAIAQELPAKQAKAKKKQAKADKRAKAEIAQQQAERKGRVLPEVSIGALVVPALDLSEVTDLSLMPSSKERSPYNKVLHHLGQPILDKDATTYAHLVEVHDMLAESKPITHALAADLEPEAPANTKAMVKAIRKARPDLSKEQAKALVASL